MRAPSTWRTCLLCGLARRPLAELRQTAKLAAAKKEADEETREEELDRRRKTAAPVPAMEAMTREELAPARPRETKEVLEVWRRGSERAGHRGIERSAHRGEEQDCGDARADLEATVGDVTVRHPIADEVEEQSEWQRAEPRTDERAAGSTGRNMKGGDQAASLASRCRLSAHLRHQSDRRCHSPRRSTMLLRLASVFADFHRMAEGSSQGREPPSAVRFQLVTASIALPSLGCPLCAT